MKYEVEIVYSKRRSLSITVSADNKVTLRCPSGYSRERAEKFLNEKSAWIERVILRNEKKLNKNADVISYENILVSGVKLPLYTGCRDKKISQDGVYVRDIKDIKKLYTDGFGENFVKKVEEISHQTGLKYNGIQIKGYKSRWGSCDGKNNLSFNYKLFMLPAHIQHYIVIHELCHTVQHNHSDKFWQLVGKFLPDYKQIKKELRGYDFITTLY